MYFHIYQPYHYFGIDSVHNWKLELEKGEGYQQFSTPRKENHAGHGVIDKTGPVVLH